MYKKIKPDYFGHNIYKHIDRNLYVAKCGNTKVATGSLEHVTYVALIHWHELKKQFSNKACNSDYCRG